MSILLITATTMEAERLAARLTTVVTQTHAGRVWLAGQFHNTTVRLVETGIGAVNTAHALTRAMEAELPGVTLQVGVGGAYDGSHLVVGDIALATGDTYADLGVTTRQGWHDSSMIGIPVLRVGDQVHYNSYPCDGGRVRAAVPLLAKRMPCRVEAGAFATVQEVSGTTCLGIERLRRVPEAICESMEGAAAAHLCLLYGVPFVQVRGISNAVEDRDRRRWNLPLACERAQVAAELLLQEWTS